MICINCDTEFKITEQDEYVMGHEAHVDCSECGSYYNLSFYRDEIEEEEREQ